MMMIGLMFFIYLLILMWNWSNKPYQWGKKIKKHKTREPFHFLLNDCSLFSTRQHIKKPAAKLIATVQNWLIPFEYSHVL